MGELLLLSLLRQVQAKKVHKLPSQPKAGCRLLHVSHLGKHKEDGSPGRPGYKGRPCLKKKKMLLGLSGYV
jgi:hypothetical protein